MNDPMHYAEPIRRERGGYGGFDEDLEADIEDLLKSGPMSLREIAGRLGKPVSQVSSAMVALKRDGLLRETGQLDRSGNELYSRGREDEQHAGFSSVREAGQWLADKWALLEGRYGRAGALAAAVAMIGTFPIPGNITAIIAAAEAIRGIYNGWSPGGEFATPAWGSEGMARKKDKIKPGDKFLSGYTFSNEFTPERQYIDTSRPGDYGADPIGDGKFRMVPSGDVVDKEERDRRLGRGRGAGAAPEAGGEHAGASIESLVSEIENMQHSTGEYKVSNSGMGVLRDALRRRSLSKSGLEGIRDKIAAWRGITIDSGDMSELVGSYGRGRAGADDPVGRKIAKLMDEGKDQDQAIAIALSMERRGDL